MPSTAGVTSVEKTRFDDQSRWDGYGAERVAELAKHPERFQVTESPTADWPGHEEILAALAPIEGSRVLELGCGLGEFSVYIALHGASVTAVDVGPKLIEAADLLARANGIECNFRVMDISALDFPTASFDRIVGLNILHHLPAESLPAILERVRVLLRHGGSAIFYEPIEDTRWFDFLQNLIPAGDPKSSYYRPSWLRRKAWRKYVARLDDRTMTTAELGMLGKQFAHCRLQPFGFLVRLNRLRPTWNNALNRLDARLFRWFPRLTVLAQTVLVIYQ